jgi:hypothetical protein
MSTIKVENFAGIAPRYSARLLAGNAATRADNAKLLSGELRGLREHQIVHDFNEDAVPLDPPITRAFRLPALVTAPIPITDADFWVGFTDPDVDFVRTPVLGDSFERYYWTGDSTTHDGKPQYNTRARIVNDDPPYVLGIPTPTIAPTVNPPAGSDLTRAYLYTFVSAYGEEGPPSPPTVATGDAGTWELTGIQDSITDPSDYNITKVRIYRTVVGQTLEDYFFVDEIDFGEDTYDDGLSDAVVTLNNTLPSLTWDAPPADLQGIIAHPGGFLVGFRGRDLYMSDPYQPHAWPVQNVRTCETEIVAVSIYNNTIVVATTSRPYYGDGMDPSTITLQKVNSIDPCISRRSMATILDGVYWSSPQGIIKSTGANTGLATHGLFTREEWQNFFSPTTVNAVPYGVQYIAFDTSAHGFIFSPAEQWSPLTTLDRFSNVAGVQIDAYTGDVYLLTSSQVRLWDPPSAIPLSYTWTSKEFSVPKPVNFGALRIKFAATPPALSPEALEEYAAFNVARLAERPLHTWGSTTFGGVRRVPIAGYVGPQFRSPWGGSPLFDLDGYSNFTSAVQFKLFARDSESRWVQRFLWTVTNERIHRLPAGYKSDVYQFELIGNAPIYCVEIAETAKELQKV